MRQSFRNRHMRHIPFALVLSGGGARGLAHAGVLRALEHFGYYPSAIVGVSMGAVVGAAYGLNPDWYRSLCNIDTRGFPSPYAATKGTLRDRFCAALALERAVQEMLLGWGAGNRALPHGRKLLDHITAGGKLEDAHLPVVLIATDLRSGERAVLRRGNAAAAAYASSALAGILPPQPWEEMLLADGGYSDIAPIDVARELVSGPVVVVNAELPLAPTSNVRNGLQNLVRALEIGHARHAELRFSQADLVLQPRFPLPIHTLDFSYVRLTIAGGAREVRARRIELGNLLAPETFVHSTESRPNMGSAREPKGITGAAKMPPSASIQALAPKAGAKP